MNDQSEVIVRAIPTGIQPSVVLPFHEDGSIDWDAYRKQILHAVADERISGLLINGHAAENHLTTDEEKAEIVAFTRRECARDIYLTSGVYAESTALAVEQARLLEKSGADALLIFQPNGWALSNDPESIFLHHRSIHDAVACPIMLYQASIYAGRFAYTREVLGELVKLQRVAGIKEGSWEINATDQIYRSVKAVRPDIAVYSSGDEHLLFNYLSGSDGSQASLAAVIPEVICDLWDHAAAGDWERAKTIHAAIQPLAGLIYGAPPATRVTARLKYCLMRMGVLPNDRVRAPLISVPAEETARLEAALQTVSRLSEVPGESINHGGTIHA